MKKKLVSILMAAVVIVTTCACGSDGKRESSGEEVSTPVSESQVAASESTPTSDADSIYPIVDEPITVKGLVIDKSTEYREDRIVWNAVSELTGINIEWEMITKEALATYLAGNDWPDFFHVQFDNSVIADYGVLGGRFVDFYDYIDVMPHLQQAFEDYPIAKGTATENNGEMYRLPYIAKAVTTVGNNRSHLRTDVLENAGLEMPTTIDEFYNCLKTLKELNGEPSYIPTMALNNFWEPFIYTAFGTEVSFTFDADDNGKVYTNYNSEQMRLYYEFMNKLYEEGLIHQEFLTLDSTVRLQLAKSGKYAFLGNEGSKLEAADFADGTFSHLTCGMPLTSEYDDTRTLMGSAGVSFNESIVINAESEYVEELCKMFDIMYATEEVAEGSGLHGVSFVYGIEGVDWDYGEEGTNTYILHTPEKYEGSFTNYQVGELIWWNTGRQDQLAGLVAASEGNNRARQIGYSENVHPYMEKYYFPESALKFTEDEQYVIDNKLVDIKSYVGQMAGKFVTGVADIDTEWDEYCETLEQMGMKEVLEVYQAAYDRWLEILAK